MRTYLSKLLLFFLLAAIQSCSLEKRVATFNKRSLKQAPFDAIIVPGYPFDAASNSILFNVRMFFAKDLYEKGITRNIIFSGAATHTHFEEGQIMKTFADSLGIPPDHSFVEPKALHSNQNAVYGRKLAKQLGFKNVVVATDPYQFSYMTLLLKIYTPRMKIVSFKPMEMPVYNKELPAIDTSSLIIPNFVPFKER
jgi:uncharacterized SAM-binding protein YcdF (DUF218 family)